MQDEPPGEVADVLFGHHEDVPGQALTGRYRSVIAASASCILSAASRLVEQDMDARLFQAPVWAVVVAALAVFAAVHRLWHSSMPPVFLWVGTISVVAMIPLADVALPVPITALILVAMFGG